MGTKSRVLPEPGEHYYCKARRDILVCLGMLRWDGAISFQRFLANKHGERKIEYIAERDFHTLKRLNEMEVLACVARLVDRRERGYAPR